MANLDFKLFASCALESADTRAKRIVVFTYFRSKYGGGSASLEDLKTDYADAGLGMLPGGVIRHVLKKDPRVKCIRKDVWMIPSDRLSLIEAEFGLDRCTEPKVTTVAMPTRPRALVAKKRVRGRSYVDSQRIKELKKISNPDFDLSRLLVMCDELNDNAGKNHVSTILLVRAILDHVPPIFGCKNFAEVANNFATTSSIKTSLKHLQDSSRTKADTHLHTPIRKKEVLPTATQVNFSQDLDVLLSEIVRIL